MSSSAPAGWLLLVRPLRGDCRFGSLLRFVWSHDTARAGSRDIGGFPRCAQTDALIEGGGWPRSQLLFTDRQRWRLVIVRRCRPGANQPRRMSADIGFCPAAAMWECPQMAHSTAVSDWHPDVPNRDISARGGRNVTRTERRLRDRCRGRCARGHTRCSGSRTVELAARHPARFATASVGDLTRTDTVSTSTAPRRAQYRSIRGEHRAFRPQGFRLRGQEPEGCAP